MPTAPAQIPAPRTGRPMTFDRAAAVEAAMDLFWRRGFTAVTASDLADAMGIRRSSFYNTFGSREAVFFEALARYAAHAPDAPLDGVLPADAAALPVLVAVLRDLCRVRARDPDARGCLVCNAVAETVGVDATVGAVLEGAVKARLASFERLVAGAVERGELPDRGDVATTARELTTFLLGLNLLSKVVTDERALWATCRRFLMHLGVPQALLQNVRTPLRRRGPGRPAAVR